MNKQELTENLARQLGCTKEDAKRFLRTFIGIVQDRVSVGEDVTLPGFGKFTTKHIKSGLHYDIASGQRVQREATVLPAFAPGDVFKRAVRHSSEASDES